MKKPFLKLLLALTIISAAVTLSGCREPVLRYDLSNGDTCIVIKNNNTTRHGGFGLNIVENTADDTIRVLSFKVAPGFRGELFLPSETYQETETVCIEKLKAQKGSIAIAIH